MRRDYIYILYPNVTGSKDFLLVYQQAAVQCTMMQYVARRPVARQDELKL